jgi:hypothetical protein
MLAWYANRVAVIIIAIVVIALAGTQLPALARVLAERHYGREASAQTRPDDSADGPGRRGSEGAGGFGRHGRETAETAETDVSDGSDESGRGDEDDEGPAPMQRSG